MRLECILRAAIVPEPSQGTGMVCGQDGVRDARGGVRGSVFIPGSGIMFLRILARRGA